MRFLIIDYYINMIDYFVASLIGNLNGIDSFIITKDKYIELGDSVISRNASSYLFNDMKPGDNLNSEEMKKNLNRRI